MGKQEYYESQPSVTQVPKKRPNRIIALALTASALLCWWNVVDSPYLRRLGFSDKELFSQEHPYQHLHGQTAAGTPDNHPDSKYLTVAYKAAVACDVPLCSTMGKDILLAGGSAVDAAITTTLCIGTINSHSSGIGGGGFMTVRDKDGQASAFNFREMAPEAATKHMYDEDEFLSRIGGLAVAVPGELAGLEMAYKKYSSGVLSWKQLFEPVIELNRNGFEVSKVLGIAISMASPIFLEHPDMWHWMFVHENGTKRLAQEGDWIRRENYARTLELIADHGAQIFYDPHGPIVPSLVHVARRTGGIITPEDFSRYQAVESEPLEAEYLGKKLITVPNPASGPALVLGLNILNNFTLADEQNDFGSDETQLLVETMKWMAAARTELGDYPAGNPRVDEVISREWADKCRGNISLDHTLPWQSYHPSYENQENHGTAHLSVLDENGMAVALTTTVNLLFGSIVCDPKTGVVLNDEMDDFSVPKTDNAFDLRPSIYNYVTPFRRPLSSTAPSIIYTDESGPELIIGAAGGSHIVTAVFQAIVRTYQYEEPLLNTIAFPRLHHQLLPETAYLEQTGPEAVLKCLQNKGHNVEIQVPSTSMNAIYRNPDSGVIHAVSDWWRKNGLADGY